jgi:4-aminobutyrate aminotransferase-like enzyme
MRAEQTITSQFDHDQHELALDWDTDTMVRLFEKTREFGLVASKSGAYRNVLRICPPLCMQMDDVSLFTDAINESFDSL